MKQKRKPKSILVIGMGRFGRNLAMKMQELGNSVMVVDIKTQLEQDISYLFNDYMIGDCTNENVLGALGVGNFDICFVTIGKNFEASIVVTSLLKTYGAKHIVTKTDRDIQKDVLKKVGADEVVYPDKDFAEKLAVRYNSEKIFDYMELPGDYSIYEIAVPKNWVGKQIVTLDVRRKYEVNILAIKNNTALQPVPDSDYTFMEGDEIILMAKEKDVYRITGNG
ncbi:MAG: TrkA family potassium uptake protein [Treponema sp.]|jgi:trk system potassium uptake protein TrkA|nr:TrkA family potassium uptake protein [Treponema sp.]